ncbi:AfsR/SARP family transcriptional regulator [Thermoactinospora rubra]|uniref:AfsR/SARP family transcriptional regulator n=1 Tax=Thermoactinospora rubra TaxID=1088767 RepID=UPI001301EF6E|nr:bacterial transcriptional activator domain-containing protein [Thermoactinospora rubra]
MSEEKAHIDQYSSSVSKAVRPAAFTVAAVGFVVGVAMLGTASADAAVGRRGCPDLKGAAASAFDENKLCRNVGQQMGETGSVDWGRALKESARQPTSTSPAGPAQDHTANDPAQHLPRADSVRQVDSSLRKARAKRAHPLPDAFGVSRRAGDERWPDGYKLSHGKRHKAVVPPSAEHTKKQPPSRSSARPSETVPVSPGTESGLPPSAAPRSQRPNAEPIRPFPAGMLESPSQLIGGVVDVAFLLLLGAWALTTRVNLALAGTVVPRRRPQGRRAPRVHHVSTPSVPIPMASEEPRHRPVTVTLGSKSGASIEIDLTRTRGLHLMGSGAVDAERALLAQLVAKAHDGRWRVITGREDLNRLFGNEIASRIEGIAGLYVATSAKDALNQLGAELVQRSRSEGEEPGDREKAVPLVCFLDPGEHLERLKADLGLGASRAVGAVVLGDWPHGTTVVIGSDGVTTDAAGLACDGLVGVHMHLLTEADAAKRLASVVPARQQDPSASKATPDPKDEAAPGPRAMVRGSAIGLIRLMGRYEVSGPAGTSGVQATDMRALLGLLAENRMTLVTQAVVEDKLWDGIPPSRHRFKVLMKATRGKMCEALGLPSSQGTAVIGNTGGYGYAINSELFTCDVWQLRDLLSKAASAADAEKAALLGAAVDLYIGPYLPDLPYTWAHHDARNLVRDVVQALSQLAALAETPDRGVTYLERATGIDPGAEHLYRARMQLYAGLGQLTAVHNCYDQLVEVLRERGRKPELQTAQLYRRLTDTN